jgi:hypothetical protein
MAPFTMPELQRHWGIDITEPSQKLETNLKSASFRVGRISMRWNTMWQYDWRDWQQIKRINQMKDLPIISEAHLQGLPGISRVVRDRFLLRQPATVLEALKIHGVGRKTTKRLFALGLLSDPEGVQTRALTAEEMSLKHGDGNADG